MLSASLSQLSFTKTAPPLPGATKVTDLQMLPIQLALDMPKVTYRQMPRNAKVEP